MGGLDWAQGQTSNSALVLLTTNHRNRTGYEKKVPPSEKRTFTTFFISLKSLSPDFQCSAHSPPNHDTTRPKYRWHTSTCHIFPTPAGLITYLHCGCIYPNVFFSDHQTMNIRVHCKQRRIIRLKIHVLLQAAFKASGSDQWSADAKRIHCNNGVRACRTACHHLEAIRAGGGPQLLFAAAVPSGGCGRHCYFDAVGHRTLLMLDNAAGTHTNTLGSVRQPLLESLKDTTQNGGSTVQAGDNNLNCLIPTARHCN